MIALSAATFAFAAAALATRRPVLGRAFAVLATFGLIALAILAWRP